MYGLREKSYWGGWPEKPSLYLQCMSVSSSWGCHDNDQELSIALLAHACTCTLGGKLADLQRGLDCRVCVTSLHLELVSAIL